jgi:hypothetical protein
LRWFFLKRKTSQVPEISLDVVQRRPCQWPLSDRRPVDCDIGSPEDVDMRRLDARLTALADEHPRRAAVLTGLAAGLLAAPLALLVGRLLFGDWAWGRFINAAIIAAFAAGFSTYMRAVWRRQDRERLERRRQRPG